MATGTATFRAIADFSAVQRAASQLKSELQDLQKAASGGGGSGFGSALGNIGSEAGKAATGAEKAAGSIAKVGSATSAAEKGLSAVSNAASNMAYSLGGGAGAAAQMVTQLGAVGGAATAAGAAMAVLSAAVAATGVSFDAFKESALVSFTTILHSGSAAADLMDRIVKTAAVTPFETKTLVASVQQMLAFGFSLDQVLSGAGKNAKGLIVDIGSAVAAMGKGPEIFERVSLAIGQIQTKGKLSGEEIRQLAENGIPVYDIFRQKLGLTAKDMQHIGDLAIPATKAIAALQSGFQERYGGALEAQSRTFNGLISTLKDSFSILSGEASQGLFDSLKKGLTGITDTLNDLAAEANTKGIFAVIQEKSPLAAQLITTMGKALTGIVDVFKEAAPAVKAFFGALVGSNLVILNAALAAFASTLQVVATIIGDIPAPVQRLIGVFGAMYITISKLNSAFLAMREWSIVDKVVSGFQSLAARMTTSAAAADLQASSQAAVAEAAAAATAAIEAETAAIEGQAVATGAAVDSNVAYFASQQALAEGSAEAAASTAATGEASAAAAVGLSSWAVAAASAVVATVYFIDSLKPVPVTLQSASTSADTLASSLGVTLTPQLQSAGASADEAAGKFDGLSAAIKNAVGIDEAFVAANKKSIGGLQDLLRNFGPKAAQDQLVQIGVELVLKGASPKDALAAIQALADKVGITVPINIDADKLKSFSTFFESLPSKVKEVGELAKVMSTAFGGDKNDVLVFPQLNAQIEDVIKTINDLRTAGATPVALTYAANFEDMVKGLGLSADKTNAIIDAFTRKLFDTDTIAGSAGKGVQDLSDYFKMLATTTEPVDADLQKYAQIVEAGVNSGKDLSVAVKDANDQMGYTPQILGDIAQAQGAAAAATDQTTTAMDDQVSASDRETAALKKQQEAFDNLEKGAEPFNKVFSDMSSAQNALGSVFDDVSDKQKKAAEKAAQSVGLSASSWKQFSHAAGVNLDDFSNALEAQLLNTETYQQNLKTVFDKYGAAVTTQLAQLGPDAAGLVAQMATDVSGKGQHLADVLTASADQGSKAFSDEFEAGISAAGKVMEDPNIDPQTLADNVGVPVEALKPLLEKYGGDAGTAWVNKFQGQLSGASVTFSTSQVTVTGSPVSIPAIIQVAPLGLVRNQPSEAPPNVGNADGGILGIASFYPSATFADGAYLPREATIAKPKTLVQWAEPETGGEAFIPLAMTKRKRSVKVWEETGKRLGTLSLQDGGIISFKDGGLSAIGGVFNKDPKATAARQAQLGKIRYPAAKKKTAAKKVTVGADTSAAQSAVKDLADYIAAQQKTIETNAWQLQFDVAQPAAQISMLDDKIAKLNEEGLAGSDDWIKAWKDKADVIDKVSQAAKDSGDKLRDLIDQEHKLTKDMTDADTQAQKDRAKATADYGKRRADAEKSYDKSMAQAQKQYADNVASAQKQQAQGLADIDKQYQESLKQRSDQFFSAANAMQKMSSSWANSTTAIIANLQDQNKAFEDYNAGLEQLKARGITKDAIDALGIGDVSGLSQVNELLKATPEDFAALMDELGKRRSDADTLAQNNDDDLQKVRSDATTKLLADSASAMDDLNKQFAASNTQMTSDYQDQLAQLALDFSDQITTINQDLTNKQADLQQQMAVLGTDTGVSYGQALAEGLSSQIPGIQAAAQAYAAELAKLNALIPGYVNPVTGGTAAGAAQAAGESLPSPDLTTTQGPATGSIASDAGAGDASAGGQYTIVPNDSVSGIARKLGVTTAYLLDKNPWINRKTMLIHPGQTIAYHSGGYIGSSLRGDEVIARLERGEGVLSRRLMSSLVDSVGMGGGQWSGDYSGPQQDPELLQPIVLQLDGEVIDKRTVKVIRRTNDAKRRSTGAFSG